MKTYTLNLYSDKIHNGIIVFVFILIVIFLFSFELPLLATISILVSIIAVTKFIAEKSSKATATFSVNENGFDVHWTRPFLIFKQPDYSVSFGQFKEYVFEPWGETYRLKITTHTGKTLKFQFMDTKQDVESFTLFVDDFKNKIKSYNNKDGNTSNDILLGKTYWEGTPAKVMAGILTLVIILCWSKVIIGRQADTKMLRLVIFTIAGLFYIVVVIFNSLVSPKK